MNNMTSQDRTEKIYGEVLDAVQAGVYRGMGQTDIYVDLGEPHGMARIDKLMFAQILAENEDLYARFKAKVSVAANR